MAVVRTISESVEHEIPKIRGSRFLASVEGVASSDEAEAFLSRQRQTYADATHNCFAWRLGQGRDQMRYSDDGEPNGTAGRPILQEIDGRRLTDVAVVVTRYYGGTKLGTGGLVRAYGEAAAVALDLAGVDERPIVDHLQLSYAYGSSGAIKGVLNAFGLEPGDSEYGAQVKTAIAVPIEQVDEVRQALIDATHGRLGVTQG